MRTHYNLPRRLHWPIVRTSPGVTPRRREAPLRELVLRNMYQSVARNSYIHYVRDSRISMKSTQKSQERPMLCLLIAAHNEELVLENTLRSAIAAGLQPEHIYVADDNSSDATSKIARSIIPSKNVFRSRARGGKGATIAKAAKKFSLSKRYRWIHIADADGAFASNYFAEFRKRLRVKNAAATGYIRSLRGKRVSEFRAYEYAIGMEIYRRIQAPLGMIPVIPGPTSCFRADVFDKLNFANQALTEDFDVTLQIYRKKLGKVQFIPEAIAYTQDPLTTRAFIKQITRWYRGGWQVMRRHKIGSKLSPIDAYLSYQVVQGILMFISVFIWIPFVAATRGGMAFLSMIFLTDLFMTLALALMAALKSKRSDILAAFPIVYALKWMNMIIFTKTFIEVIILRKFRVTSGAWENGASRRYRVSPV